MPESRPELVSSKLVSNYYTTAKTAIAKKNVIPKDTTHTAQMKAYGSCIHLLLTILNE